MKIRTLKINTLGRLYLHSMPGRYEELGQLWDALKAEEVTQIVSLASIEEIRLKSPEYAKAIAEEHIPAERISFPIPDYGVPSNIDAFYQLACNVAKRLTLGENILIHCAGGIGRTGMLAGCVLAALHLPQDALKQSGSGPESEEQEEIIQHFHSSKTR
jgi:protein-tyrosine phosphatase